MKLKLEHVGPIEEGELAFGDLTLLVGPQASGKTIVLQILKLMLDAGPIQHTMARYGLNWSKQLPDFLDLYFGEGMRGSGTRAGAGFSGATSLRIWRSLRDVCAKTVTNSSS